MKEKDIIQQIGTISHEIRNPLSGIIDLCRLLASTDLNEEQANYVQTMQDSAETLLLILNDYVDTAKIESSAMRLNEESFLPSDMIQEVAATMSPLAKSKNLSFITEISGDEHLTLNGDKTKLKQVLFNLTANAVKFTDTGTITLSAEILPSKKKDYYTLKCLVKDTGIGFSAKEKKLLFKKFSQLKNSRGGSGLGLAVSQKIIELMGGEIKAASTPNLGSEFSFCLTLSGAEKAELSHVEKESIEPLNILLAEDNQVSRKVTALLLAKSGHTVTTATNGKEAISLAEEKDFDLILMDMNMPEIDGISAARSIRKLSDRTKALVPIFAMSGNTMDTDKKTCTKAGMNGFLSKPLDKKEFIKLWNKTKKKHGLTAKP